MGAIRCNRMMLSWWLLVLAYFIDSGDGQRGNGNLNKLRRDVRILHQLTDNIQHEIKLFYDQEKIYSEDLHKYETEDHTKKHHRSWLKKHRNYNIDIAKSAEHIKFKNHTYPKKIFSYANNTYQNLLSENIKISHSKMNSTSYNKNNNDIYWPKFDDILRSANTKYDWKNDRWIKLKNISNEESKNVKFNNVDSEDTKPRFRYSRVKINGSNSKRNIVIAISAMPKEN